MIQATELAHDLFGDDHTIEERYFDDGDNRTIIKHSYGWSSENYVTILVWVKMCTVWVEYYEHDIRRSRDVYDLDEWLENQEDLSTHTTNW